MRRNVIRLTKKILIWIKRNLQSMGMFFLIVVPIVYVFTGTITFASMLLLASLLLGWALVGADAIIKNKDDILGMPIPPKRFTSLRNERIIIKKEEIHEIAMYLYNLEEYLEEVGKADENRVKK